MFKYVLLVCLVGGGWAAPAPEPKPEPAPAPAPKPLAVLTDLKTPASTTKLAAPLIAPIAGPIISPISRIAYAAPVLSHVSPIALTYSAPLAPVEIAAAAPASYSIEQHGYHITY